MRHPPLGRIFAVKLAYLAELVRPQYELWTAAFDFSPDNHGPYSRDVIKILEWLTLHQYAELEDFRATPQGTRARYLITDAGTAAISAMRSQDSTVAVLCAMSEDLIWVTQALGVQTAVEICALVYQEPAFARIVASNGAVDRREPPSLPSPSVPTHPSFERLDVLKSLNIAFGEKVEPRTLLLEYMQGLALQAYQQQTLRTDEEDLLES
jgi:hypothetical protein